jgi:NADH dehydrogenase FAD-containing subunit
MMLLLNLGWRQAFHRGVEFSGELSDFIINDVSQTYAHAKDYVQVTLIEVCLTTT